MGAITAVALAFIVFAITVTTDEVKPDDIAAACAEHGKVQQYVPTTWEAFDGNAAVVCKDGTVHGLNESDER